MVAGLPKWGANFDFSEYNPPKKVFCFSKTLTVRKELKKSN